MRHRFRVLAIAVLAGIAASACATAPRSPRPTLVPPAAPTLPTASEPAPVPVVPPDPVQVLIDLSQESFDKGQAELGLGHLDRARTEFNRALDLLLESPEGARATPRLQEHFDRLVDRISAYEVRALVQGDGFTEQPDLPASLDELLALSTFELPPPPPELRNAVELDLKATAHDIPIPVQPKILAYIDLFQGRLRDWFQASLLRGQPHLPMIQAALRAEGLPQDLAFIPIVESAFHTNALSRAKAKGFWQLMRGTAVEQGLKHDWYIDERANPERATAAAVRYLKVLNKMFRGDWHLTLASYNGGPGTVQRAVRRKGVSDFWRLAEKGRYLPRETREYVPMVLAAMVVASNPGQYGFTLEAPTDAAAPDTTPAPPDIVELPGPVDLRRIAEWAGVSVEDVQRLNPELRRLTTPLRGVGYKLRVPAGSAATVSAQLAATSSDDLVAFQYHTVRKNESLTSIANKLRVRRTDLAEANYLSAKSRVKPGDRLVIPRASTTVLASRTDARPDSVSAAAAPSAAARAAASPNAERVKTTYRVRKGDTLSSIARAHGTTVDALREWNRLTSSRLMPGDRLTVYARRDDGGQQP